MFVFLCLSFVVVFLCLSFCRCLFVFVFLCLSFCVCLFVFVFLCLSFCICVFMKVEMPNHLCGILPGSRVLCYEVHADTGSMHCDRTATGKHGLFFSIFQTIFFTKVTWIIFQTIFFTKVSPVVKGWGVPTTGQPWGRIALNLKKKCLKNENCTIDILRRKITITGEAGSDPEGGACGESRGEKGFFSRSSPCR